MLVFYIALYRKNFFGTVLGLMVKSMNREANAGQILTTT